MRYQHTQVGYTVVAALIGAGLVSITPALLLAESLGLGVWLSGALPVLGSVLFCSLTVRVTEDTLIWYFGPQFWRNTLSLEDIERVRAVRNSWGHGWGIRMIEGGWLYNVSGFQAIEIETEDGEVIRIGTDEPERLATVIRAESANTTM